MNNLYKLSPSDLTFLWDECQRCFYLKVVRKFIDDSCAADLDGVTFAFVCVDKGSSRSGIFDLLILLSISYR